MENNNVSHTGLYQNGHDYYIGDPIPDPNKYEIKTSGTSTITYPPPKEVKRVTKTIEKYNNKGKLKSKRVIITEEEIIQKQENPMFYQSSYTDSEKYQDNFTFTNSLN